MDTQPEPFSIATEQQDGRFVVCPRGELDLATAPDLEAVLLPALADGRHVVLDLRKLEFMDSSGVRALVEARNAAAKEGDGRFSVVPPEKVSPVWRVLEVSGVDSAFELLED